MIKHSKPNIQLTSTVTLDSIDANYFITLDYSHFNVTLPDVAVMSGQALTFTTINTNYEGGCAILGPIDASDTSFSFTSPSSATFLSDGNRWWIIASYGF